MIDKNKKKQYANSLWTILLPLAIFIVLGVFFAIERQGLTLVNAGKPQKSMLLPQELMIPRSLHKPDIRCLLIENTAQRDRPRDVENLSFVLDQLSVGFTRVDIGQWEDLPPLENYTMMIIACEELRPLYADFQDIFDWVHAGGGLLFAGAPEDQVLTNVFYAELGVERDMDYAPIAQVTATLETDLLAGGKGNRIQWSDAGNPNDYRHGYNFRLDETCETHISGDGPDGKSPMLWDHEVGLGRVAVNNNDAFAEMWSRGLVAAAISLTEPALVYPVINAAVQFIDDFPAPIPEGYNDFIRRDFGVQTEYFYTHVWFPDMLRIADRFKIKYSGVIIETYEDLVRPPFAPSPSQIAERLKYFGSLFLNEGHEIGMHGYNHQSLALESFDYRDELPYNKWPSTDVMAMALKELDRIQGELFPGNVMRTYVPPSNVLTDEGRAMLRATFPDLNLISGLLVDDIFNIRDDFGIADDGFINFPRISSGFDPLDADNDEQPFWAMLNELNLHFVVSHFIHPDDPMDPDRGANKGWKKLSEAFERYFQWIGTYPIRNMVSQEAAPAVQRWNNLTVHTAHSENAIDIKLDGFIDEAWLFVRVNEGTPRQTRGGVLTHVSERLYLLKADAAEITITLEPAAL